MKPSSLSLPALVTVTGLLILTFSALSIDGGVITCAQLRDMLILLGIKEPFLSILLCIACVESGLDTSKLGVDGKSYGIFQINEISCKTGSSNDNQKVCDNCTQYRNDDVNDDIDCAQKIKAQGDNMASIKNNGFNMWPAYKDICFCKSRRLKALLNCGCLAP